MRCTHWLLEKASPAYLPIVETLSLLSRLNRTDVEF